jgi:acyl-coenzyme A synthetase/AMP-(fatty) acid ligase
MCAVVGIPDELRGQVPAAYVVLRRPGDAGPGLAADLQNHVRTRLAAHEVPRVVHFVDGLPRTTTGKIMRRLLREPA